jgi:hypothetical protein
VFEQYLTTTQIPVFEYRIQGGMLSFHWANVVPGFRMPVIVYIPGWGIRFLDPTEGWRTMQVSPRATELTVDENFYVTTRQVP